MTESLYDAALDEPEIPQVEEPIDVTTSNLLNGGNLTDVVVIGEHEIRIRTLKIGEELEAILLADKWKDTNDVGRALMTALVAASIMSVDGNPLITPLGREDTTIQSKFDYIRSNWYWPQVAIIYKRYDELVRQLIDHYNDLKKN